MRNKLCDKLSLKANIDPADMRAKIWYARFLHCMLPVSVSKVWQKAPAVWLKQHQMPAADSARFGKGYAGDFFIYDINTIDEVLQHLLDNMYVQFGDQLVRQAIGTPMGTNCASLLANFYLAMYELDFLSNLADIADNPLTPTVEATQAKDILTGSMMTGRFIDDLLSINNPYLKFLLYTNQSLFYADSHGIYPDTLLLSCTHTGEAVPYMDIEIRPEGRGNRLTMILWSLVHASVGQAPARTP